MKIAVNGEMREIADGVTVADVVPTLTAAPSGVAVALNGELISRSQWAAAQLHESDQLEVLSATAGG